MKKKLILKEPTPIITRAMILRKFQCIEDFADKAEMSRQSIYQILKNPRWGYRKDSRAQAARLLNILVNARKK